MKTSVRVIVRTQPPRRSGVVLIVILGMLAALALLGIAFTTFSAQEEQSSANYRASFQTIRVDMSADVVLAEVLQQIIADTDNPLSALRSHSLGRDMYGNNNDMGLGPDGVPGTANGGPLGDGDDDGDGVINNAFEIGWPGSDDVPNGVVNTYDYYQRAFDGPGESGPDDTVGTLDDADVNYVYNLRRPEFSVSGLRKGGVDEDYDYPDHNNMLLAAIRADGTVLVPSLHRPGYLNPISWVVGSNTWTDVDDWNDTFTSNNNTQSFGTPYPAARGRRLILRPRGSLGPDNQPGVAGTDDDGNGIVDDMSERLWPNSDDTGEHPLFVGNVAHIAGRLADGRPHGGVLPHPPVIPEGAVPNYDVDNMGLGRTDAVWLDLGFPVQRSAGGIKFKPLVAITAIDLDGKLNLNAHGNLNFLTTHSDFAAGPGGQSVSTGSGASVNEIILQNIFSSRYFSTAPAGEYTQLFEGKAGPSGVPIPGKWGDPELIATGTPSRPGATTLDDESIKNQTQMGYYPGFPGTAEESRPFSSGGVSGTPPDFDGDAAVYAEQLPPSGWGTTHIYNAPGQNGWGDAADWAAFPNVKGEPSPGQAVDEPMELNLYASQSTDFLFSPRETELLYRGEDVDWSSLLQWLPSGPRTRLSMLAPSLFDTTSPVNRRRRMMLGTESWDLIRYNMWPLIPRESAVSPGASTWLSGQYNGVFPDLYRTPPLLAQKYLSTTSQPNNTEAAIPEAIRSGRRLNVAPQLRTRNEKYLFARDLYTVLVEVCGAEVPADRLAQFAINVVDFSDSEVGNQDINAEEVMEPFEFDNNLPNGFGVDAKWEDTNDDIQPGDSDLVWGSEAPRVIISETFAYEDDTDNQVRFWIELYNISDKVVDLRGLNNTYELVWDDRANLPTFEGEPSSTGNRLVFDMAAGAAQTTLQPGEFLVIGPEPTPTKFGPPISPDYIPAVSFRPPTNGQYRLYLRRLADPSQAEDTANRSNYPRSLNPYITIDALDVLVHDSSIVGDPDPLVFGTVTSIERQSLSVKYLNHPPAGVPNGPTHTLSSRNVAATELIPAIWFPNRPLLSTAELMLVPAVGSQHITTAFFPATQGSNFFSGGASTADEDLRQIETGQPRSAPFKNSDGDYLYSYGLNFFREDPTGAPPAPQGSIPPRVKGRIKRSQSGAPTPGFYRLLEFVEVPSRMNGSRDASIVDLPGTTAGRNRMERVPGKININTIWEQEIFQSLCNNHPLALDSTASSWFTGNIPQLRVGDGIPIPYQQGNNREQGDMTAELWRRHLMSIANNWNPPGLPATTTAPDSTLFTPDDRPFRSLAIGAALSTSTPPPSPYSAASVHHTLLRGLVTGSTIRPILADDRGMNSGDPATPPPGLTGVSGAPLDLAAFPQFHLQMYQKLSDLVTTRSNVYAVWVTVGFFEVLNEDPYRLASRGIPNAPPELGSEVNVDIGQNIRHRGFFIIDRSKARGYLGPPRSSAELQDILSQVLIHSRIIE